MVKRKKARDGGGEAAAAKQVPPEPPADWTRCHAYNHHKKRFCRQEIHARSAKFCGNHLHMQDGGEQLRERIPCPIDPTHFIFADCLDRHVKKCPKRIQEQQLAEKHFFRRHCNCGGHGAAAALSSSSSLPPDEQTIKEDSTTCTTTTTTDLEAAKRLALRVLQVHQEIFSHQQRDKQQTIETDKKRNNVPKLLPDEAAIHVALPAVDLSAPELDAGLAAAATDYRLKSGGSRHLHQQASIVGLLRRVGALQALNDDTNHNNDISDDVGSEEKSTLLPRRRILEMGAGRGMTGLIVAGVSAKTRTTHLTMIEKDASRSRAEKFLRKVKAFPERFATQSRYLNISAVGFDRIRCDLAHLDMCTVFPEDEKDVIAAEPETSVVHAGERRTPGQKEEIIVLAKHLCGVGTDLALKSLEPIKDKISCCVMSTCCHGVCDWRDYVGRDHLAKVMVDEVSLHRFGEAEFELLCLWSTGTVRDIYNNNNIDDDSPGKGQEQHKIPSSKISEGDRVRSVARIAEALRLHCGPQGLGRACQRMIDFGRREYLRNVLFLDAKDSTQMLYYVPPEVTPQNAVLIAHRYPPQSS